MLKRSKRRVRGGSRAGDVFIMIVLIIMSIFMLFPFYFSFIQSIKPFEELFIFPPKMYAKAPTLNSYKELFNEAGQLWVPFSRYLFNSFFVAAVVTVSNIFVSVSAGYALAKVDFPGRKALNKIIEVTLLFSSTVTSIMTYIVLSYLHMINTYWALIFPLIATPTGLYLMRQFMGQINTSMIEAARMDGAGHFRTCWKIVAPNVKPAIMTLVILGFTGAWNAAGTDYTFNEELKTLPTILQQVASSGTARTGLSYAGGVLLVIPPMIAFLIAQGNVMETMSHSGMKD